MAKDLPYFKFFCSEWSDGDITLEDYNIQGLFINICSYYWSNECDMELKKLKKKFKSDKESIDYLIEEGLIKISKDLVVISFLDEQFSERKITSKQNSKNAKSRWDQNSKNNKGYQLYILKCFNDNEEFIKIGATTTSISRRFSGKIPYEYKVILSHHHISDYLDLECELNKLLSKFKYSPKIEFAGKDECYSISSYRIIERFILDKINVELNFALNSHSDNHAIKKREEKKREEKISKNKFNFRTSLKDLGLSDSLINDFAKVRKAKKSTNTELAFNRIKKDIDDSGLSYSDAITYAVENSWNKFNLQWYCNKEGIDINKFKGAKKPTISLNIKQDTVEH